jgi:flagellin
MGLRISTNVASINAQRRLSVQQDKAEKSMAQLASGDRITKAADDAAGLAISEDIRGQSRGIRMARQNAFNAVSMIQVGEGGLNEISNILIRLRELGVQAASDNIGDRERNYLNLEAQQLLQEADRIALTTRFGNQQILDGTSKTMEYQVGAYSGNENIISYKLKADARASALGISGHDISDKKGARRILGAVDKAIEKVSSMRADFGAVQSRLQSAMNNLDTQYENLNAANARIRDTDVAQATSEMASANILQQAAVAVLSQANQYPATALRLIG